MTLDVTTILVPVFWAMVALVVAGPAIILVARALRAAASPVPARRPNERRAPRTGRRTQDARRRGAGRP